LRDAFASFFQWNALAAIQFNGWVSPISSPAARPAPVVPQSNSHWPKNRAEARSAQRGIAHALARKGDAVNQNVGRPTRHAKWMTERRRL